MPQDRSNLDPEVKETTDPRNPPQSVLQPAARRAAVWTYVGGTTALFIIVAALFGFWSATDRGGDLDLDRTDLSSVGTSGDRGADERSPGGFDPDPDHDSTRDELQFKGGEEGPMPGPAGREPMSELAAILDDSPEAVDGRRIDLRDVDVESGSGDTFVIRDGNARAAVLSPDGSPAVRAGQRVDVSGHVEADGSGHVRIRATHVEVKR